MKLRLQILGEVRELHFCRQLASELLRVDDADQVRGNAICGPLSEAWSVRIPVARRGMVGNAAKRTWQGKSEGSSVRSRGPADEIGAPWPCAYAAWIPCGCLRVLARSRIADAWDGRLRGGPGLNGKAARAAAPHYT
ncbi:hypothetical protein NDU88_006071 [Pleurodeles waltl]|uniref:Uncharacterized protein n=1 Tax=Pleurodeles waltl TaxID=8319 RepID=A0AAV7TWP9_PLEWA|nr:hypothetical protein NDU88_006071 [Pleurodeles waltl]